MSVARVARARLPADWPLWTGLLAVEAAALATYLLTVGGVRSPRYLLYPFVWINLGLYAVFRSRSPDAGGRRRAVAAGAAAVYALALAVLTGLIGLPLVEHGHGHPAGWFVSMSAPGWGPRVGYVLGHYHAYLVPYRVVGYAALAYLLYASLAELSPASGAGLLGLAACVSCSLPILATLAFGAGAASLSAVGGYSLDVSTAAFLVAVGAMWWPRRTTAGGGLGDAAA